MIKLFDLNIGDKFELSGNIFTLKRFFKEHRPTLGKVWHAEAVNIKTHKIAWFISNLEVKQLEAIK